MKNLIAIAIASLFSLNVIAADPPTTNTATSTTTTAGADTNWMKYSTPNEHHKVLNDVAGKFKYTANFWMTPGAKAETTTGTSTNKWILGGRFLQQEVKGKAMGQPFNGMSLVGFDSLREQYQSIWVDTMSTHMMQGTGTYDTATKTLTETGEFSCAMTNSKNRWYRTEMKITDKKNHTYAMFTKDNEGKEFKSMEINYTRTN